MTENMPLVSIGLPVYNGEKYLTEAIESLLAQDYTNIEIIISDNASTDNTPQICQQFQQKDPRVRYFQNSTNIGHAHNFTRTFELSNGDFFMWAAFDDLRAPTYISKCLEKLKQHPNAWICVTECAIIDEEGKFIREENNVIDSINLTFSEKLHQYFLKVDWIGLVVYGLWRSKYLKQTRGYLEEFGPDIILGLEAYLLGDVIKVEERLFFYRYFPEKTWDDIIGSITSNPDKQRNMSQTKFTQVLKNLYQTLIDKNMSPEIIEDFFEVFVYEQQSWVQSSCLENAAILKDQILEPEYVYEFFKKLVTSEKSADEIVASLESSAQNFQRLADERPIILLGSFQESILIWWKYFIMKHITIHGFVEESSAASHPNFYEKLLNTAEQSVPPFVIIVSPQPHIHIHQLIQKGYEHRKDFLHVNMNTPFLYLI